VASGRKITEVLQMKKKRIIALVLITLLVTAQIFATGFDFDDVDDGSWYAPAVNRWGDILAEDDLALPLQPVTRAEFAHVLNTVLGFPDSAANFVDVTAATQYSADIGALQAAGVVTGRPGGIFDPYETLRRDEAAVMVARAFGLPRGEAPDFADIAIIQDFLVPYLASLQAFNYVRGNPDGTFAPDNLLIRAEIFQIVHNTTELHGNMVVTQPGAVISDRTITGNLVIAPSVGNGSVTLDNVVLNGSLVARGGGGNSITITGDSVVPRLFVNRVGTGDIRINAEEGATVSEIVVNGGTGDIIIDGEVDSVVVAYNAAGASLEIAGTVGSVVVAAPAASVVVADTGSIESFTVAGTALAAELVNNGSIEELVVHNATVEIINRGSVETAALPEGVTIVWDGEGEEEPPTIIAPPPPTPPNNVYE
jgi:hypothetical protein